MSSGNIEQEIESLRYIAKFHSAGPVSRPMVEFYLHDALQDKRTGKFYVPHGCYVLVDKSYLNPMNLIYHGAVGVDEVGISDQNPPGYVQLNLIARISKSVEVFRLK